MSTRAQLSETINRLLPGEQYKRIREAILQAANYSGQRTDQLRQSIDEANRVRTGLLVSGTIDITSDTSATLSGYAWVVDFAVQQPTAATTLTITAPDALYPREDYFIGTDSGTIIYRAGTVDSLGNSRPPSYNSATEVVLVRVVRNPDSDEIITVDPGDNLIDFVEQNIIPLVRDGKLKNSGIQALLNSLGEIIGYQFPTPVKGSPAINEDEFVTKAQLPTFTQYGLLSGGTIQYSGTGQKYLSSLAVLAIGETLIAPASEQTLDAADPTFDRFDVLGWQYVSPGTAALFYLKGTAAASPTIPQVNPETQVQGKVILVPAASTAPSGITTENVYLDNAEWTVTKTGTGTLDADSTDNPKTGTKAVKTTDTANNYRVRFTRSTTLDLSTLTDATLGLDLDLIAAMANNQSLAVVFLDAAGNPASNQLFLQLNKGLLDYQFLGLALAQFNFTTTVIKAVEFIFGTKGGGTFAGFYLDNVKLQGGVEQPVSAGLDGSGTANEIAYFTAQKVLASLPVATYPNLTELSYVKGVTSAIQTQLNSKIGDAPSDGSHYARKDAGWVAFTPGIQHATSDGSYYASKDGGWVSFVPFSGAYADLTGKPSLFTVSGTPAEGHVVTYVSGVPTWAAPSGGGGSKWTDVSSDIYRDSAVAIGRTTIPTNATFAVQSKTTTAEHQFFKALNNAGSSLFHIRQDGETWFNSSLIRIGNPTTGIAAQGLHIKSAGTLSTDITFRFQNAADVNQFTIYGNGEVLTGPAWNFGTSGIGNLGGRGPVFKGTVNNTSSIFRILNSSDQINLDVNGDGSINIRSHLLRVGSPSSPIAQGPTFKSSGNASNQVAFRIMDSTEKDIFSVFSNGAIIRINNPSASILSGFHYKGGFNNGTQILMIDNSSDSRVIEMRGNGQILMPLIPTSPTGLPSKALYIYNDGTRDLIAITP